MNDKNIIVPPCQVIFVSCPSECVTHISLTYWLGRYLNSPSLGAWNRYYPPGWEITYIILFQFLFPIDCNVFGAGYKNSYTPLRQSIKTFKWAMKSQPIRGFVTIVTITMVTQWWLWLHKINQPEFSLKSQLLDWIKVWNIFL